MCIRDSVYTIRVDSAGNYVGETAAKLDFAPVQEYSGSLHLTAICVLAGAAILGVIFAFIASKAAKDKEAALAAAAACLLYTSEQCKRNLPAPTLPQKPRQGWMKPKRE